MGDNPMNGKLSRVEIRQQAELVQSAAKYILDVVEQLIVNVGGLQEVAECLSPTIKNSHAVSIGILPKIRGLRTVVDRVQKDAGELWNVGKRFLTFDEDMQPELGFTPYWTHVEDAKVFAGDLEEDLDRILSFTGNLETNLPQLQRLIYCLQTAAKNLETVKQDLRRIHLFTAG